MIDIFISGYVEITRINIKLPPVPPPLPLEALSITFLQSIVTPRALAESQRIILNFFDR